MAAWVASRAEAWVETVDGLDALLGRLVASRAEAWVETALLRVPGGGVIVASRAEAWVETSLPHLESPTTEGRLPRGGVG